MEEEGQNDGDKASNEFNKISEITPETVYDSLLARNNIDLLCIKAKNCHAKYDIHKAYEICLKAIKMDPLYFDIIPVYCACLLHLDYLGELYYCAHNLVENYTTHPLTWFAIGTYYYLTKKYEIARKYFQKVRKFSTHTGTCDFMGGFETKNEIENLNFDVISFVYFRQFSLTETSCMHGLGWHILLLFKTNLIKP